MFGGCEGPAGASARSADPVPAAQRSKHVTAVLRLSPCGDGPRPPKPRPETAIARRSHRLHHRDRSVHGDIDGTVISTSLPAIAIDLHQDPIVLKLALTSYMLTLAVFIPASGWVADRFGARTVFCSAIIVFTLGSIRRASSSLSTLIAARVFQGLGGAMMVPVGRLVLLRSTAKSDLVSAMAYLTVPALIGPVAGPPLGGFITTYFHWRWIFWINVPIGVSACCSRSGSSRICASRPCPGSISRDSSCRASAS